MFLVSIPANIILSPIIRLDLVLLTVAWAKSNKLVYINHSLEFNNQY